MSKLSLLIFPLLFLLSCQSTDPTCTTGKEASCGDDEDTIFIPGPEDEPPTEAYLFDATVKFVNFNSSQQDKVLTAIELIKQVVATPEFKHRVVNYTYNGKKQFVDNKGLSNEEIYRILLDGKEDLLPEVDYQMDLELELYYSVKNTVGYTYPNTLRIWMNTKYFNNYTPAQVAGNLFHEWLHKLGFDHASSNTTGRSSSVPYAIGYLIEELAAKQR